MAAKKSTPKPAAGKTKAKPAATKPAAKKPLAKPVVKKTAAQKPAVKPAAKKPAAKKPAAQKTTATKTKAKAPVKKATPAPKAPAKKAAPVAKQSPAKKVPAKKSLAKPVDAPKASPPTKKAAEQEKAPVAIKTAPKAAPAPVAKPLPTPAPAAAPKKYPPTPPVIDIHETIAPVPGVAHSPSFISKQKQRLLDLRDDIVDAMSGMTRDTIRNAPEGSEASGSGQHQGDAGSDAYDRDFALSVLAKEQDALYEIEQALRRIQAGAYGICEISGKKIPTARLEAIPFARLTVECQAQWEKEYGKRRFRPSNEVGFSGGNYSDDEDSDSVSLDEDED